MGRGFRPDRWTASAYAVDYEALYREGFRGIIFDIDNTLVFPNAPADERSRELFSRLRGIGFRTVILSNNTGHRARLFAQEVGSDVVPGARKPFPGKYRQAMARMGTDEDSTVFIGDQIFTDIWGANNARITSVLTDPLTEREMLAIRLRRPLEERIRRQVRGGAQEPEGS